MTTILSIVDGFKAHWQMPRKVRHRNVSSPLRLTCTFASSGATPVDIEHVPLAVPDDVRQFWLLTRHASLFTDQQYGQWGIDILDPPQAWSETQRQIAK